MKIKKELYAESGVKEYWIVDYNHETLTQFSMEEDGNFGRPLIFTSDEIVPSVIFPDFILNLVDLFPAPPPEA